MCAHTASSAGLGALRREVGDLRLEGADEIGGGVDDGAAEPLDRVGRAVEHGRQLRRIGVEPDAQHRLRRGPRGAQLVAEVNPGTRHVQALAARKPSAVAASGVA